MVNRILSHPALRNGYVWAFILVAATDVLAWLIHAAELTVADMIFLPAVLVAALRWGLGPAVCASSFSLLSYIAFILIDKEPLTDGLIIHFGEMGIVFAIVSFLSSRSRKQTQDLRDRARIKLMLLQLSKEIVGTSGVEEVALKTVTSLKEILGTEAVLLMPEGGRLLPVASSSDDIRLNEQENESAIKTWGGGTTAKGEEKSHTGGFLFYPMVSGGRIIGVLGVQTQEREWFSNPHRRPFLEILTVTIAAAIEREIFARSAAESRILRRQEELNTALLSSISHDFRTPLASIIGAAETLSLPGAVFSEETKEDILRVIREEAERLNRFVGNLLDMTRLEAGALNLNLEWVDIGDIVGAAINQLGRLLQGQKVIVEVDPEMPMIRADFVLMEHVIMNLLENAVNYTPSGSPVYIRGGQQGDEGVISVIDSGRGIPVEDLDHVFEKFYRLRHGDVRSAGTGLGLLICKGIIEAHGGTISVISPVSDGKGTMIRLSLPLKRIADVDALLEVEKASY